MKNYDKLIYDVFYIPIDRNESIESVINKFQSVMERNGINKYIEDDKYSINYTYFAMQKVYLEVLNNFFKRHL